MVDTSTANSASLPAWLVEWAGGRPATGERLRHWGLSEVWRVRLPGVHGGAPVIVKRVTGEMTAEVRRYRELVVPLGAPSPRVVDARLPAVGGAGGGGADGAALLVLADVGAETLEQRPTADGYREAVRVLARMRRGTSARLVSDPDAVPRERRWTAVEFGAFARRAAEGLAAVRPDLAGALDGVGAAVAERLAGSGRGGSAALLVHGDYHAKNLVLAAGGAVVPVDWPTSYVADPGHLGDLYCLLREARQEGRDAMVSDAAEVFAAESGLTPAEVRDGLTAGGLCWTVLAIRWVVEEGADAVPESRAWLDDLTSEARSLARTPPERPRRA